jgi:hypothetical protein
VRTVLGLRRRGWTASSARARRDARAGAAALAGATLLTGLGFAGQARAQQFPPCGSTSDPVTGLNSIIGAPLVYVEGPGVPQGAAGGPAVIQFLGTQPGPAFTFVYIPTASCNALQDLIQRTGVPAPVFAFEQLQSGGSTECILEQTVAPDFVISEFSAATCAQTQGVPAPAMVTASERAWIDLLGPIEVASLVVPAASKQLSISADAAYVVFGFGGAGYKVDPWTDAPSLLVPSRRSGPLNVLATLIGMPLGKSAVGMESKSVGQIVAGLDNPTNVEATLAVLPTEVAESQPHSMKPLAFEAAGQSCAYLPDSDALHGDRINVRQGRYALWSPLHVVMNVDVTGQVIDHTGHSRPILTSIASFFQRTGPSSGAGAPIGDGGGTGGSDAASDLDSSASGLDASEADDSGLNTPVEPLNETIYFTDVVAAGLVPWCAMQVARATDLGAEMSYQPPAGCGCAFESTHGATLSGCLGCRVDGDCTSALPKCRFGYCEAE